MLFRSSLIVTLSSRQQIFGFISREWLLLLALIVGAQILGHTMFNLTLPRVSPAIVSLIVFFEVPVSAILAFLWIGQLPSKGTFPGVVLLLLGCAIFVVRNRNQEVSAKSE